MEKNTFVFFAHVLVSLLLFSGCGRSAGTNEEAAVSCYMLSSGGDCFSQVNIPLSELAPPEKMAPWPLALRISDLAETEGFFLVDLRFDGEKWYSSWKYSTSDKTIFRYFIHVTPAGGRNEEISEAEFTDSVLTYEKSKLPEPLKKIVTVIAGKELSGDCISELTVRDTKADAPVSYLVNNSGGSAERYEKICAVKDGERYFLSAERELFLSAEGEIFHLSGIKELPEDYRYTALLYHGGKLYAAWEQQHFFNTGHAGLLVIDENRVEKILQ